MRNVCYALRYTLQRVNDRALRYYYHEYYMLRYAQHVGSHNAYAVTMKKMRDEIRVYH